MDREQLRVVQEGEQDDLSFAASPADPSSLIGILRTAGSPIVNAPGIFSSSRRCSRAFPNGIYNLMHLVNDQFWAINLDVVSTILGNVLLSLCREMD